jgi:hypothetical protein
LTYDGHRRIATADEPTDSMIAMRALISVDDGITP